MGLLNIIASKDLENIMTEKINTFKGNPVATNEDFEVYFDVLFLDEFKFLNIKVLGPLNIETLDGCMLNFISDNNNLQIESDSMEIISDFSRKLNIGITEFDIDLDEDLITLIENDSINTILLTIKKNTFTFSVKDQKQLNTLITL